MTDEPKRIATAAAALDDPYAALSQHLHGDGDATPPLRITYRNWRGEVGERNIVPQSVWFGATEWHPEPQWLLSALDTDKGAARDFALADFGANDDTWRTRALAAEAEVERLRAATGKEVMPDEGLSATPRHDTSPRLTAGAHHACATPGCTNLPAIWLDGQGLCWDCYATHNFGDDA